MQWHEIVTYRKLFLNKSSVDYEIFIPRNSATNIVQKTADQKITYLQVIEYICDKIIH